MAFVSVDNNKFLSLFLLGVHIKAGVIFLMQAANRLGMCLLELVLLFVHLKIFFRVSFICPNANFRLISKLNIQPVNLELTSICLLDKN